MYLLIRKSIQVIKEEGFKVFLFKVFNFLLYTVAPQYLFFIFKKFVIKKIKDFNSTDPEKVFDFSYYFFWRAIRSIQIKEEFLELLRVFKERNPKYILEIGTANGGTLFCFSKLAPDDATIISIDLPGGKFGGGYPDWKIPIYRSFAKDGQKFHLIREDSHASATSEKVKRILSGRQIDFLFIDGDHSYGGIKEDFEVYKNFVKKGGVIVFHDVAPNGKEELVGGVPRFWREIKSNYQYNEFVSDISRDGYGIGILFL